MSGCKDVASVYPTRQDKHFQVVFGQKNPALVLKVDAGISEHAAHGNQFFIVYFQYVATLERVAQDFFGVEALTQVDVEDAERVGIIGHSVEEPVDGLPGNDTPLGQRTETYGTRLAGQSFEGLRVGNVIPGHSFFDVVTGHALGIEFHLNGSGGIGNGLYQAVKLLLAEVFENLGTQLVFAHGAHYTAFKAKL